MFCFSSIKMFSLNENIKLLKYTVHISDTINYSVREFFKYENHAVILGVQTSVQYVNIYQ